MQTMALVTWDISKLPVRQITLTDAVFATHSFLNCLCGR